MKKLLLLFVGVLCSLGMWADATWTWTVPESKPTDFKDGYSETLTVPNYGDVKITYHDASSKFAWSSNILKFGSTSCSLTISLPTGKTFKQGDSFKISTKGGNSGSAAWFIIGGDINTYMHPVKTSDAKDEGPYTLSSSFTALNSIDVKIATSSDTYPNTETKGGGSIYLKSIEYTKVAGPTIETQPASASYAKDATASALTVSATASSGTLTYQWYSNATESTESATKIDDATSASYTPSTTSVGKTYYFCVVKDDNGTTNSDIACINVMEVAKPSITTQPTDITDAKNEVDFTLSIVAESALDMTYQWYSNTSKSNEGGTSIDEATNASYTTQQPVAGKYFYYCVVTNTIGSTTSNAVEVTVAKQKVAEPVFEVGAYDYTNDAYPVTISCATTGASLTYNINGGRYSSVPSNNIVPVPGRGTLIVKANKDNWDESYTQRQVNKAPYYTSPETLIPVVVNDNFVSNKAQKYRSVNIASTCIAGVNGGNGTADAFKLRTNQKGDGSTANSFTLTVNSGYTVTKVDMKAFSNNAGLSTGDYSGKVKCTGYSYDSEETTSYENAIEFPLIAASQTYETASTGEISATNKVTFIFDNSNIGTATGVKNNQIIAEIKVYYTAPEGTTQQEVIYTNANGVASYVANSALDFTNSGLTAYICTGTSTGTVTLAKTSAVKAGDAVVLKAADKATTKHTVSVATTAPSYTTNLFKASDGSYKVGESDYVYCLNTEGSFQKVAQNVVIPSGKAYLKTDSQLAKTISLFDFDEVTAINDVEANTSTSSAEAKKAFVGGKFLIIKGGKTFNAAGAQIK